MPDFELHQQTPPVPSGIAPSATHNGTIAPASVAKNSILLFGFQVLTKILGFFSFVMLANYFGTEKFGEYNYAFALTALFVPLCDLGMDIYLLREIPRISLEEASALTTKVLRAKFLFTIGVFILIAITAGVMETIGARVFIIILLTGIVTPLRTYWTTFSSVLRALNRVRVEAVVYSLTRLAEFLAVCTAVLFQKDMISLLVTLSIINAVASVYTYYFINKKYLPLSSPIGKTTKQVVVGGLPFAITGILVSIYFNFDTVLVSKIVNDNAAGIYRAAYNLILPLTMVTAAVSGAVFPYVSQNYLINPEQVSKTIRRSLMYLLMTALPIAVITTFLSKEIVQFLFKPEYADASTSLIILVWFLPVAYVTNLFGHVLGAMDNQTYVLKISAVNVVVNIVSNVILIPYFAQNGAAFVTVLTESVGFVMLYTKIRTHYPSIFDFKELGKILIACAFAGVFLYFKFDTHVLILLTIAVILYAVGLFVTRAISIREVKNTLQLLKERA